jgi:hypothetical protein
MTMITFPGLDTQAEVAINMIGSEDPDEFNTYGIHHEGTEIAVVEWVCKKHDIHNSGLFGDGLVAGVSAGMRLAAAIANHPLDPKGAVPEVLRALELIKIPDSLRQLAKV